MAAGHPLAWHLGLPVTWPQSHSADEATDTLLTNTVSISQSAPLDFHSGKP